jgi:putative heme iron utilization protein
MSYEQEPISPMFRIDVSAEASDSDTPASNDRVAIELLRQLVAGQQQQNRLLEDMIQQQAATHKQRAGELQQWKNANPDLARACRQAAETLSRVQTQFLDSMTDEIADSEDHLLEGEYMLNEFVDRFGPRLAHLNGVLQVLAQLGSGDAAN